MNVTISKSIGNTFLLESEGSFYDLVFWKKASQLLKSNTNISDTINACPGIAEINARKELPEDKLSKLLNINIDWIDKKRTLRSIIDIGIQKLVIYVRDFDYNKFTTKFTERENPEITYYLVIDGLELAVKKSLFLHFTSNPEIKQRRAV